MKIYDFIRGSFTRANDWRYEAHISSEEFTEKRSIVSCILDEQAINSILHHEYLLNPSCIIEGISYFLRQNGYLEENYEHERETEGTLIGKKYPVLFKFPFNSLDAELIRKSGEKSNVIYSFFLFETYNKNTEHWNFEKYDCEILLPIYKNEKPYSPNGILGKWWESKLLQSIVFLENSFLEKGEEVFGFTTYKPISYSKK